MLDALKTILENLATEALLPLVASVLSVVFAYLASRLVTLIERKLDVDISEKQEGQLDKIIEDGIDFAEEQARKAVKGKDEELYDFTSEDKIDLAIDYVEKRAKKANLDKVVEEGSQELAERVEARLFKKRKDDSEE